MFNRMYANAGMNKFGEKVVVAMVKEYTHIYKGAMEGKSVVTPIDPYTLSHKEKSVVLEMVNLIKRIETVK